MLAFVKARYYLPISVKQAAGEEIGWGVQEAFSRARKAGLVPLIGTYRETFRCDWLRQWLKPACLSGLRPSRRRESNP